MSVWDGSSPAESLAQEAERLRAEVERYRERENLWEEAADAFHEIKGHVLPGCLIADICDDGLASLSALSKHSEPRAQESKSSCVTPLEAQGGPAGSASILSDADRDRLMAERDEARRERDEAIASMSEWARKAGEAQGELRGSEMAGAVAGWRDRAQAAEAALASAREEIGRLKAAATRLAAEIEDTEEHGEGAFEESCPICQAVAAVRALTPEAEGQEPRDG